MNLFGRRAAMVSVSLLLTAASPGPLQAQRPPAEYPLLAVPKADTVFLYLTERPPLFGGFVVDRTGPEGQEIRLTEAPVRRIRDPSSAAVTLGRELERVRTGVRATSDAEILRRLDSDPFLGGVFSLLLRPVARVMGRLYVDTTAVPGQAYTYRATLTDADGVELDSTFEASVAVRDVSPAPPTAVDAEASDARAHLTWEYPPYTGEQGDYTIGFHVERSGDQGPFRRLTDLPIVRDDLGRLEYYDDDARNGTTYRYRVVAVGIAGRESEPVLSPPVTPIDETAPTPPTGLEIQVGDGQALLVWQLPPELDVAGFHVERAPGLNEPFQRLNPQLVPAQSPRWLDTTAVGATRYFYRVLAVDSAGNESRPSSGAMAVVDDRTAPAPPDSVRVEVVDRR
ncbi:MAG: hypothetical protein GWN52_03415, partial [Gemmatimonadetes bacterium]|nr:hypothetical protein [Gemmatimonadota bacterium]NIV81740.1 hypothetical protein [Gemmatimonadota bacterium]